MESFARELLPAAVFVTRAFGASMDEVTSLEGVRIAEGPFCSCGASLTGETSWRVPACTCCVSKEGLDFIMMAVLGADGPCCD